MGASARSICDLLGTEANFLKMVPMDFGRFGHRRCILTILSPKYWRLLTVLGTHKDLREKVSKAS